MFRIDGALCEESVDNARDPTIIKRTFCSETHDEALKLNKWLNKGKNSEILKSFIIYMCMKYIDYVWFKDATYE